MLTRVIEKIGVSTSYRSVNGSHFSKVGAWDDSQLEHQEMRRNHVGPDTKRSLANHHSLNPSPLYTFERKFLYPFDAGTRWMESIDCADGSGSHTLLKMSCYSSITMCQY